MARVDSSSNIVPCSSSRLTKVRLTPTGKSQPVFHSLLITKTLVTRQHCSSWTAKMLKSATISHSCINIITGLLQVKSVCRLSETHRWISTRSSHTSIQTANSFWKPQGNLCKLVWESHMDSSHPIIITYHRLKEETIAFILENPRLLEMPSVVIMASDIRKFLYRARMATCSVR